jgi:hypothetical protein
MKSSPKNISLGSKKYVLLVGVCIYPGSLPVPVPSRSAALLCTLGALDALVSVLAILSGIACQGVGPEWRFFLGVYELVFGCTLRWWVGGE